MDVIIVPDDIAASQPDAQSPLVLHLLARWLWDYELFERVLRDIAAEGVTGLRDLICLDINEVPHVASPSLPLTFALVLYLFVVSRCLAANSGHKKSGISWRCRPWQVSTANV